MYVEFSHIPRFNIYCAYHISIRKSKPSPEMERNTNLKYYAGKDLIGESARWLVSRERQINKNERLKMAFLANERKI